MSLKIGHISLAHGLILAPMAGVTDRAYRHICRRMGAEYTVTEMVSAKALHFNDATSRQLGAIGQDEQPTALQLFGHEPEIMAEAISKMLLPSPGDSKPVAIDINMGCPMKKIVNNGDGSALMRDPLLAGRVIRAAVDASDVPITVKIRAGWDSTEINAPYLAKIAEENGASLVCVHGRTRDQMYEPQVNLDVIAAVKASVSIPVVANGGIFTADDAMRMLAMTQCDGLMLARGTMGNPWLFEEIAARIDGRSYHLPDLDLRLVEAMKQMEEMIQDKGERTGVLEARRQLAYYIKNVKGAAEVRGKLNLAQSKDEIQSIMDDFLRNLSASEKGVDDRRCT